MTSTDSSGKRFFDLVYIAITDRKSFWSLVALGSVMFIFTVAALGFGVYIIGINYPNFEMEIGEKNNLVFRSNSKEIVSLLMAANGDHNRPWINTGLRLERGDMVRISASGKICLAAPQMIGSSDLGTLPPHPWIGPQGIDPNEKYLRSDGRVNPKSWDFRVCPDEFMGRLIGVISSGKPQIRPKSDDILSIGENFEMESPAGGELWLAINDIWLDHDALSVLISDAEKKSLGSNDSSYLKRLKYILVNHYHNAWFDDNAGAFMVNIQVEN